MVSNSRLGKKIKSTVSRQQDDNFISVLIKTVLPDPLAE